MTEHIVVGSGPAGVAAAKALLANNKKVLMIDVGRDLPGKKKKIAESLKRLPVREWKYACTNKSVLRKLKFDSNYSYETPGFPMRSTYAKVNASFAKGGFSTVWGAAVLPYEQQEMRDWPKIRLEPYYKKVFEFMPLSGTHDDLAKRFPLYAEPQELASSIQANKLLTHWKNRKQALTKSGFVFGRSRLAVQAYPKKEENGCVYCGLCMTGCPNNIIYSSATTVEELKKNKNFTYRPGVFVQRVSEAKSRVRIHAISRGKNILITGKKVFLAAGVYSSTAIMLRSKKLAKATAKDSQYIIIPGLMTTRGRKDRQHALSQLFLELKDKKLGNVHLQVYTFSDLVERGIASKLGPLFKMLKPLLRPFVERIVVIQAFLHSDISSSLEIQLQSNGIQVTGKGAPRKRLSWLLLRHAKKLGVLPLLPFVEYGLPGQGNHSGGSFPMSDKPGSQESDTLGRCGFENVHIVDSSIMSSIAATTITLTEMANAYRIAHEASKGRS